MEKPLGLPNIPPEDRLLETIGAQTHLLLFMIQTLLAKGIIDRADLERIWGYAGDRPARDSILMNWLEPFLKDR